MSRDRITEAEIDAGGKALREHDMAGRITRKWEDLPNSDAQKWRLKAKLVLAAALNPSPAGPDRYVEDDVERLFEGIDPSPAGREG